MGSERLPVQGKERDGGVGMHGEERLRVGEAESYSRELLASGSWIFAAGRSWQLSIFRPVADELERLE